MAFVPKTAKQQGAGHQSKENAFFSAPFIQPKLTVNEPGDAYEQEADAVADKVMRMPDPSVSSNTIQLKPIPFSQIQRKCAACEKDDEEKHIHRKESASGGGQTAPSIVNDVIASSGKSLDGGTRQFMESRMGHDFSNVQVHTDSKAAESAASVNALAYTSGNHVVFNSGQYSPDTEGGKRLLAHELVHVGQQRNNKIMLQTQMSEQQITENEWVQSEENFFVNFKIWLGGQIDAIHDFSLIFGNTEEDSGDFKINPLISALAGAIPAIKSYAKVGSLIFENIINFIKGFDKSGSVSFIDFSYGLAEKYGNFQEDSNMISSLWNIFKHGLPPNSTFKSVTHEIRKYIHNLPNRQLTKEKIITAWVNSSVDSWDLTDSDAGFIYMRVIRYSESVSKPPLWFVIKGPMIDDVSRPIGTKQSLFKIYGDKLIENLPFKMVIDVEEDNRSNKLTFYQPTKITKGSNSKGWIYKGSKVLYDSWISTPSVHPKISEIDVNDT